MRPRASVGRQRDQILRTLLILGGLSGGDSEPRTLLPSIGTGMGRATSKIKTAGAATSPFRTFEPATACGDTVCLQQECDAGIVEVSHMLAIFRQQLCSSSVMLCPDAKQAARGCAKRTSIRTVTRIFEALFNIVILPHYNQQGSLLMQVAFPDLGLLGKATSWFVSLPHLLLRCRYFLVKRSEGVCFLGLLECQFSKFLAVAGA